MREGRPNDAPAAPAVRRPAYARKPADEGLDRALNSLGAQRDVEAGGVDAVVAYEVDRLSRSLADVARVMRAFGAHRAAFVSVTQ